MGITNQAFQCKWPEVKAAFTRRPAVNWAWIAKVNKNDIGKFIKPFDHPQDHDPKYKIAELIINIAGHDPAWRLVDDHNKIRIWSSE